MARSDGHIIKAVHNTAWQLLERMTTLFLNFLVAILVARYLGPEDFGSLNYAIAFVALMSTISHLGFGGVVVEQLVRDRASQTDVMGTVFWAKGAAALIAIILANLLAALFADRNSERLLVLLISFSMLFDVSAATRLIFEARRDLRRVALVTSGSAVLIALARVIAVATRAPLWAFAALVSVQAMLTALGYLWTYSRHVDKNLRLPFRRHHAVQLLRKSWPLILSVAAATVYLKVDQFMLGQMLGMTSVGIYSVASRLSEFWYAIPIAVATSVFPSLVELKSSDPEKYERRIKQSIRYLLWASLLIAGPVSLLAPTLIVRLYGEPYRDAGIILAIHVWACPAVFMGTMVEKWFVIEDLLKFLIGRQLMSAAVNVGLNLLLIPRYGGAGAAIATVISYTLAYYLSCFTSSRTAPAGHWMNEAIFWPLLYVRRRLRSE